MPMRRHHCIICLSSHSLLVYLQVEQAVARAGGDLSSAERICAEDRIRLETVDDDVQRNTKAKPKSKKSKDEDALASLHAELEITRSELKKVEAETVAVDKNKDNPVLTYIEYLKSQFINASAAEFIEFKNQTNSLIARHDSLRAAKSQSATQSPTEPHYQSTTQPHYQSTTQPHSQPTTQPLLKPGASYQREQQPTTQPLLKPGASYQREKQQYRPRQHAQHQTEMSFEDQFHYYFPRPPPIMSMNAPSTITSSSKYSSPSDDSPEEWQPHPDIWPQRPAIGGDVFSSMNKQYMQEYMQQPIIQPVSLSQSSTNTSFGSTVSELEATVPLTEADIIRTLTEMVDIVNTSSMSISQMDTSTITTHSSSENTSETEHK